MISDSASTSNRVAWLITLRRRTASRVSVDFLPFVDGDARAVRGVGADKGSMSSNGVMSSMSVRMGCCKLIGTLISIPPKIGRSAALVWRGTSSGFVWVPSPGGFQEGEAPTRRLSARLPDQFRKDPPGRWRWSVMLLRTSSCVAQECGRPPAAINPALEHAAVTDP